MKIPFRLRFKRERVEPYPRLSPPKPAKSSKHLKQPGADSLAHVADQTPFPVVRRDRPAQACILDRSLDERYGYFYTVRYTMRETQDQARGGQQTRFWSELQFVPASLLLWQMMQYDEGKALEAPRRTLRLTLRGRQVLTTTIKALSLAQKPLSLARKSLSLPHAWHLKSLATET